MSAQQILKELKRLEEQIYKGVREGMVAEGEAIMKRSNGEFAPRDEGDLIEESGITLIEEGQDIDKLEVVLHYGGPRSADYVLPTHEHPGGYDPPTWKGKEVQFTTGGPQYLSKPLFEAENGMIERIAGHIKLS